MLLECEHIRHFWIKVSLILGVNITWKSIIVGIDECKDKNAVISLISYIMYKKFQVDKDKTNGSYERFVVFAKKELICGLTIYQMCKYNENVLPLLNSLCIEL